MKFFSPLGASRKNVLSNISHKGTKHFNLEYPEINYTNYTTTLARRNKALRGHQTALLIQLSMYICCLLKLSKRSREFYAMRDFRVNRGRSVVSALDVFSQKKLHGFTL